MHLLASDSGMEFLWSFEGKENIKESEAHIITYGVLLDGTINPRISGQSV